MPVTKEDALQMRSQLEADRELCSNSSLAQQYLDSCEEIQNAIVLDLGQSLIGTDDADSVSSQELESMAADLCRWSEDLENIPESERESASYRAALELFQILKSNYVVLFRKNELRTLLTTDTVMVS